MHQHDIPVRSRLMPPLGLMVILLLALGSAIVFAGGAPETTAGAVPGERAGASGGSGSGVGPSTVAANPEAGQRVREIAIELGFAPFEEPLYWADAEVLGLNGGETGLHAWSDRVVLLHFWATWCPSCLTEMPSIERLQQSLDVERAALLAVNLGEPEALVNRWLSQNPFDFPIVLNPSGSVGELYSVWALPTTYLVGADGYIYAIRPGAHVWDNPAYPELLNELYRLTAG